MIDTSETGRGGDAAMEAARHATNDHRHPAGLRVVRLEPSRPPMVNPDEFDGFCCSSHFD
jgi:hypothetical protein